MSRADIKLGYSCNNECIHCVISDFRDKVISEGRPEDIPEEEFRKELLDSRQRTDKIMFTGGEPTIRKELLSLVAFARDIGYEITMQTNGRKLSDMKFARALCSIAPIGFCIALHGHNAEIHDAVTQREGSFYETVQGIRNIIELRTNAEKLSGKIVISKINAPYLLETARLMVSLGFSSINLTFPHACGNARKDFFKVVPRYTEVAAPLINAIEMCRQNKVYADTETIPYCFLPGFEHRAIEIRMAKESYIELKQYGNDEKVIDWASTRLEIKKKFPQCINCRFYQVCEGPWYEYPENYGEEEFVPVKGKPVGSLEEILKGTHVLYKGTSEVFKFDIDNIYPININTGFFV